MLVRIFVVYVFKNRRYAQRIKQWSEENKFGDFGTFISTMEDEEFLNEEGNRDYKRIEKSIAMSDYVFILLGDDNSDHPWLMYENKEFSQSLKRYLMRIPAKEAAPPSELNSLRHVAFNPNAIKKLLSFRNE